MRDGDGLKIHPFNPKPTTDVTESTDIKKPSPPYSWITEPQRG